MPGRLPRHALQPPARLLPTKVGIRRGRPSNLQPVIVAIAVVILVAGCGSSKTAISELPALTVAIDTMLDAPRFENAFWGVKIVDPESGLTLYERNAKKSFVPASNMKLYTTAAGLETLGPNFRWTTEVFIDGDVSNDTLLGNLVIRGSGDPSIGGRFNDGDLTATFRDWADSLKSAGVYAIKGDIIGDDDVFDDLPLGPGWMWDDESYWYNAELGALSFNDNCIDLTVEGIVPGDTGVVYWEPLQTGYVTVLNQSLTIHPDSASEAIFNRRRASNIIEVDTRVSAGDSVTTSITVANATRYFAHVLREVLEQEGIAVGGAARDVDEFFHKPDYSSIGMKRVASYRSPPLSEIIATINKPSHNLYAEQLFRSLPVYAGDEPEGWWVVGSISAPFRRVGSRATMDRGRKLPDPRASTAVDSTTVNSTTAGMTSSGLTEVPRAPIGTSEGGADIVDDLLVRAGVDTSTVVVADGSGLSRYNLVTPEATVRLLMYMRAHPDTAIAGAFMRSLPVGGVDGTIENLITGGPAVGNLRAKTGTMSGVRSLSGFISTADGRPLVFSMMANHHTVPTSRVNDVQRRLVDLLARL